MILRKKHRKITLTDEKKYLLRLLTIEKKTEKKSTVWSLWIWWFVLVWNWCDWNRTSIFICFHLNIVTGESQEIRHSKEKVETRYNLSQLWDGEFRNVRQAMFSSYYKPYLLGVSNRPLNRRFVVKSACGVLLAKSLSFKPTKHSMISKRM